uniref:NADH dehydrogenase [ubiquinone] 1 alpha subcomplex assembly factor 4 n=1 Tax=Mola mola TaxID=94237 RepID=A0A3Q3WW02_MOLML
FTNMGARVARLFRNINLENRVHREISKEKPRSAPRHVINVPPVAGMEAADSINQKNDPLLTRLQSVYVESTDTAEVSAGKEVERRPLKFILPGNIYGPTEHKEVPKGKLTIGEALKALSSHQRQPQTWTPEKIAQDYSLDLRETKALVEFFIPFQVHIIPPKTEQAKQIQSS